VGAAGKLLDTQITGGSTAVRDGFDKMRRAGASAREALKSVASQRLRVPVAQLRTEGGAVIAPDGTALPYAALAEAAAQIEPPQVEPRPRSAWRLIGTDLPRPDMPTKVTGTQAYGLDTRLPGMKFATVRMNPRLGGAMRGFDPAPALAVAGVERVIDLGTGIAVVARNTWAAMQGALAAEVDWGEAPYPAEQAEIMAQIEAAFDTSPNSTMRDDGDDDQPGTELSAEYRLPYLAHAPLEPQNATALYDGGTLTLWSPNQAPQIQQRKVAEALGIDRDQVTVNTTAMGGGFGRRSESDFSVFAARVAQAMPGTPVQVAWSREEDMTHDFYRPAVIARMRGKVDAGRATLLDAQVAAQSLMAQFLPRYLGLPAAGPDRLLVEGLFDQPYAIPRYRARGYTAEMDLPIGTWRSVGSSHNGFVMESFIDEMAHAAGRDPLEFRLELARPESPVAAGVLEAVRAMSDWDSPRPPGTALGVAMVWSFGTPVAEVIEVVQEGPGIRIARAWIACDPGIAVDPQNLRAQMEGGMIYGLSAAVHGQITFADGRVEQQNFPDTDGLRMAGAPRIAVQILQTNPHVGGVGEPGTPPAAPALANALFALTGTRARELPLERSFRFVL